MPRFIAALAAWCATADRLIVELRSTGANFEDVYPELVWRSCWRGRVSRPASAGCGDARPGRHGAPPDRLRRGENVLVTIVIPVVVLLFFASVGCLPDR